MIWVIGAEGMLGQEVVKLLEENKLTCIKTGHELDISNYAALEAFIKEQETKAYLSSHSRGDPSDRKVKWIINCAAYTAVEKAEKEKKEALLVNATGAENIARAARYCCARLIHISTDYVFDGSASSPYDEDQPKRPLGSYGESKSLGEDAIQKQMTQYYIIRTAWLYGPKKNNFVYTMTKLMNSRPEIKVVADQKGTPTYAPDLAEVILKIIKTTPESIDITSSKKNALPYGIYNYTNEGETTWYEFAQEIYRLGKKYLRISNECSVSPCTTEEFGAKVERPHYSVLSKKKISQGLKLKIPSWKQSLEKFIKGNLFDESLAK